MKMVVSRMKYLNNLEKERAFPNYTCIKKNKEDCDFEFVSLLASSFP